jgi:putative MFS transporter
MSTAAEVGPVVSVGGHATDSTSLVGARLDRLPITGFHRRLLWPIGLGLFVDMFDFTIGVALASVFIKNGFATFEQTAVMISLSYAGLACGGLISGVIADRFGRRLTFRFSLGIVGIASLAAALAPDIFWLIGLRALIGVGLGAEQALGQATLAEFLPPPVRGKWLGYMTLITNAAIPVSALIGFGILPHEGGWRWLLVLAGVMAFGVLYLRRRLPESPRWLEAVGRASDADQIVRSIEAEAPGPLAAAVRQRLQPARPIQSAPYLKLFSRSYLPSTLLGTFLFLSLVSATAGLLGWLPSIFVKQGFSIASSLGFQFVMSLGGPVGALLGAMIADKLGRKTGIIGLCLAGASCGVLYSMAASSAAIAGLGFAMYTLVFALGTLVVSTYIPEMFPTELRMRGVGTTNAVARIAAIGMPFVVVALFNHWGVPGVVALPVGMFMAAAILVALFGVETRHQPLETIASGRSK